MRLLLSDTYSALLSNSLSLSLSLFLSLSLSKERSSPVFRQSLRSSCICSLAWIDSAQRRRYLLIGQTFASVLYAERNSPRRRRNEKKTRGSTYIEVRFERRIFAKYSPRNSLKFAALFRCTNCRKLTRDTYFAMYMYWQLNSIVDASLNFDGRSFVHSRSLVTSATN